MADNDYNVIKPVGSLQNIGGLTPADHRKKKQQNSHEQQDGQHELTEDELNESTEEDISSEIAEEDSSEHTIDYRA